MIPRFFVLSAAALVLALTARANSAEVVSVECVIKSVEPSTRSITVSYKVGTAEKSITLDVSRKAKIVANGEEATLETIGPGQKATIEYDKDLAIVTNIQATGNRVTLDRKVLRFTLSLSEFGDGKVQFERTKSPAVDDFAGESFTFSRLPRTKATKGQDGQFRLVHDFADPDDLSVLAFQVENVILQRDSGVAVFAPQPKAPREFPSAQLAHSKQLRPPLSLIADIVEQDGMYGMFLLRLYSPTLGMLTCRFWIEKEGTDGPYTVEVVWQEVKPPTGALVSGTLLCDRMTVNLKHSFVQQFRLPLPNARIANAFQVYVRKEGGQKPTTISRLELRGGIAPILGVTLAENQGMVFAKTIIPNGLGEQAGIQQGDVILEINAKHPTTMVEAMNLLSLLPIGEDAVINVQRRDATLELRVKIE